MSINILNLPVLDGSAEYDPTLPLEVRQLLGYTGSEYEAEKAERAALNWRYFKNSQYQKKFLEENSGLTGSEFQRAKDLWAGIKPLFNITTHAVDVDRRLCFKKSRPLPQNKDAALEERLRSKWDTDRWGQRAKRSPLYGAVLGNSFLRVIEGYLDGTPGAPSRLEVYTPEIMTVLRDQHNHNRITAAKIEYDYFEPTDAPLRGGRGDGASLMGGAGNWITSYSDFYTQSGTVSLSGIEQRATYTMIITEEAYYTFRNHEPHAFGSLGNSWANKLGMVPVVDVPFDDIGEDQGLPTFHSIIDTLDAINTLLTMFGQIVKMHADPLLMGYGITPGTIEKGMTEDGETTVLYVPIPAPFMPGQNVNRPSLEYLEWKGSNAAALLEFVSHIRDDCRAAVPETLYEPASKRTGSGYEAMLDLQPVVDKIESIREEQFDGMEDALQMALVADDARGETLLPDEAQVRMAEARQKYNLYIWTEPVLPRDRATEAQVISVNLADKVTSRHQARLDSGLTYIEAAQIAREVEQDWQEDFDHAMKLAEAQAELNAKYGPGAPNVQKLMQSGTAGVSVASGKTAPPQNGTNAGNTGNGNRGTQPTPPTGSTPNGSSPLTNHRVASQPNRRPNNPA